MPATGRRAAVYAKPKQEQPDSLCDHFDIVERGLPSAGVRFHVRPAMHEKVAVIDQRVLAVTPRVGLEPP